MTLPLKKLLLMSLTVFTLTAGGLYYFATHYGIHKPQGGDFTLHSVGKDVSLHDFKGKGVILYFGYTSCPDVCPVSMSKLAKVIKKLSPEEQSKLQVVFVSVDTRGDTPEKAQSYASFFMPGAVGLTGSKAEVDAVVQKYGTAYSIEDMPKSALGYSVEHPTSFFLVNRKGKFEKSIPTETPTDEMVQYLRDLF
jgi:protein SCO1/2